MHFHLCWFFGCSGCIHWSVCSLTSTYVTVLHHQFSFSPSPQLQTYNHHYIELYFFLRLHYLLHLLTKKKKKHHRTFYQWSNSVKHISDWAKIERRFILFISVLFIVFLINQNRLNSSTFSRYLFNSFTVWEHLTQNTFSYYTETRCLLICLPLTSNVFSKYSTSPTHKKCV